MSMVLVGFFVVVVFNDLGTGAKFITDERALECMLVCSSKRKKKKGDTYLFKFPTYTSTSTFTVSYLSPLVT